MPVDPEAARSAVRTHACAHRSRRNRHPHRRQGAGFLRQGWPAHADRDRSHLGVRPRARHDPLQGTGAEPARRVLVRAHARGGAEPRDRGARPERDDRPRVPRRAARVRRARLPDRGHEHGDLDRLRAGRARLLRPPPAGGDAQARAPAAPAAHAHHQGRAGRARRADLARRGDRSRASSAPNSTSAPRRWCCGSSPKGSSGPRSRA